tara:strand:+ start:6535 stop:7500 length:966 start_codon:yes stop_codon:yes gene_type:complete
LDLEEQILHYYLKVFSFIIFFVIFSIIYVFYVLNKNIELKNKIFYIEQGERIETVFIKNIINFNTLELFVLNKYYKLNNFFYNKFIHYGDFSFESRISSKEFLRTITNPSNVFNKITIVEGWSKIQLERELIKNFTNYKPIPYSEIIADTYFFQENIKFDTFLKKLKQNKLDYFFQYKANNIYKSYTEHELMIIGSLIEKEGLDKDDKRNISSVIFNRLKLDMKLQIDATVLFSITNGKYNLERKLIYKDLLIDHPYNTYKIFGLPPNPISYVGKETLDVIFENYQTDFLFYFFDNSLKRHIFSKTYKEHKRKLYEYRSKK